MTQTVLDRHALSDAFRDFVRIAADLTETVLDGRDSRESADLVFLNAAKTSSAVRHFFTLLSIAHADNLGIDPDEEDECGRQPNSPSENAEDFAGWAGKLASERVAGPITPLMAWTSDPYAEHRLGARQLGVGFRHAAE